MGFKKWQEFPITITPGMIGSHFGRKYLNKTLKKEAPRAQSPLFQAKKNQIKKIWRKEWKRRGLAFSRVEGIVLD
jgi:hypothetical protein